MRREHVRIADIDVYDHIHQLQDDGSYVVDVARDGKTTEEHVAGVDYLAGLLRDGVKLMPPLLQRNGARFKKLDGFKRILAHQQVGAQIIEAFVAEADDTGSKYKLDGLTMTVKMGGQTYTRFTKPTEYEEPADQHTGDGEIIFLYHGKGGFRIELREAIHVHWGPRGRNRLLLGREDFDTLCDAVLGANLG